MARSFVHSALRWGVIGVLVLALLGAGTYLWASTTSSKVFARSVPSHTVDFPVPFPLPQEEIEELGLSPEEAEALALERALERGRHLLAARYPCAECHGSDYGGGVMVDAFPIGQLHGPNLTAGEGSRVPEFTTADWDRIVRHGILPDGRPAVMPSEDFLLMSDQELSDIIAYIQALPPVDREAPPIRFGPLGKVLVATGQIIPSVDHIEDHDAPHLVEPPPAEVSLEFGRHLAGVCVGCHRPDFTGGPIAGGDPAWVPAANLTPHPEGLAGWSYSDFDRAMRDGVRPDGTEIGLPMTLAIPFAQQMTEVEMEALWMYLQSVPGQPTSR
jgi:mono/diheme cytochrome c family protein